MLIFDRQLVFEVAVVGRGPTSATEPPASSSLKLSSDD